MLRMYYGRIFNLLDNYFFIAKLVFKAYLFILYGGVGFVMVKVREKYWVFRLRRLVKKLRGSCYGCIRFRVKVY